MQKKNLRKIIIDVDTGTDDAIALMAAIMAKELEVVALCSVHGNASVQNTTRNTLSAAYAAGGGNIPVYPGAEQPMVKNLSPIRAVPVKEPVLGGGTIIDGVMVSMNPDILPLPESPRRAETMPAALFYVKYLRSLEQKITIVCTGALTNLGIALRMDPTIVNRIEELVIMGGGVQKSNITSAAEANFFKDPEAAQIVLECGIPITLCCLDATHSCTLTVDHERQIRQIDNQAARFTANDIRARIESYNKYQPLDRKDSAPIHDALCVAYLIDDSVVLEANECCCAVDCCDGICEGHLTVDTRFYHGKENVRLVTKADPDKLCKILCSAFRQEENE